MTKCAGRMPRLDVLAEDKADGGIAGTKRGDNRGVQGFEHLGRVLRANLERALTRAREALGRAYRTDIVEV